MIDQLETTFGYVDGERANVGAYASPLSSLDAFRHAQETGSRVLTSAEYGKAIEQAENLMQKALQKKDIREFQRTQNILLNLYGIKIGNVGYAGARESTSTVLDFNKGSVKEVNGTSRGAQDYIYGREGNYTWVSELEKKTRELQSKGLTAFIQEFDPEMGLPVAVSSEPNEKYHGAVFSISPDVKDLGVVVRGQHHSVGEPSIKYNIAVLPLDYKDIMLGPRTVSEANRTKLGLMAGAAIGMVYDFADKVKNDRISLQNATEKVASYLENSQRDRSKLSRRHWLQTAGTLLGLAAVTAIEYGCGGGSSGGGGGGGPPPVPTTYEHSGSVSKRIAKDGSRMNIGEVVLEGIEGTFRADIDSAGNFRITGIKPGTYKRTIRDKNGDSIFVPQVESVVTINGNLTGQDYSAIERGANRFGVPFDGNFQAFYEKIAQRVGQTSPGIIKWGNGFNELPTRVRIVASTVPDDVEIQFRDAIASVVNRDTVVFSGERVSTLPVEFGEVAADLEIEKSFHGSPTISDYPLLSGRRIVRSRVRYDSQLISDALRRGADITGNGCHEFGHCWGAADFVDANFDSVMNSQLGRVKTQPTSNDKLAFFVYNHKDVKPGNTSPDTNL